MPGRTHCIACGTPLAPATTTPDMQKQESIPAQEASSNQVVPNGYPSIVPPSLQVPVQEDSGGGQISNSQNDMFGAPSAPSTFAGNEQVLAMSTPVDNFNPQIDYPVNKEDVSASSANFLDQEIVPGGGDPSASNQSSVDMAVHNEVHLQPETKEDLLDMAPSQPLNNTVAEAGRGEGPRVNVQFNDADVAEAPMPIYAEPAAAPATQSVAAMEAEEGSPHTGPWLAIIVIVLGLGFVVWLLYFVYSLLFGGSSTTQNTNVPVPTSIVTTTPVITPTPVVSLSANDVQRERDVADLRSALAAYYQARQRYPVASNYNSLLNSLIGGGYLSRRVQDPAFPAQEYRYSVDSSGNSYDITITFDTTASALLGGSASPVFHLRPQS